MIINSLCIVRTVQTAITRLHSTRRDGHLDRAPRIYFSANAFAYNSLFHETTAWNKNYIDELYSLQEQIKYCQITLRPVCTISDHLPDQTSDWSAVRHHLQCACSFTLDFRTSDSRSHVFGHLTIWPFVMFLAQGLFTTLTCYYYAWHWGYWDSIIK